LAKVSESNIRETLRGKKKMATYKTPGVYMEEISNLPPSIAPVETAIPAFIGYTEKAIESLDRDLIHVPKRISSLQEYQAHFGVARPETTIVVTVRDRLVNGQTQRAIEVTPPATPSPFLMYYSIQLYFANGGGPCYIVSVNEYGISGTENQILVNDLNRGLTELEKEDEPTLIYFPDAGGLSGSVDTPSSENITDPITELRNELGSDKELLKFGAAYFPHLLTTMDYHYDESSLLIHHDAEEPEFNGCSLSKLKDSDRALYSEIPNKISLLPLILPPGSAVAGVYVHVDSSRGVWKAPANVEVKNVQKPVLDITNKDQEGLNVDSAGGKSVNAIRTFEGKGNLIWGARTLAGKDNEWRYVPVRRFFNFVEESVKKGTGRFVFEPNDANTWVRVKATIGNFLTTQWRNGALAGAKPDHAFFVKVGLGETMTSTDILEGRMNIEIGMAVVRPAEFIILKFSHIMQEA
jgi:phage tail sheath protein FI